MLPVPINAAPEVDLEAQAGSLDRYVPAFRFTESGNGANGFMLVDDEGETKTLSHRVQVTASLFDILSSSSQVDHPLCEECTDALLDFMDQQLKLTEDEWNDYNQFLKRLHLQIF
jgi:beclin 1